MNENQELRGHLSILSALPDWRALQAWPTCPWFLASLGLCFSTSGSEEGNPELCAPGKTPTSPSQRTPLTLLSFSALLRLIMPWDPVDLNPIIILGHIGFSFPWWIRQPPHCLAHSPDLFFLHSTYHQQVQSMFYFVLFTYFTHLLILLQRHVSLCILLLLSLQSSEWCWAHCRCLNKCSSMNELKADGDLKN